MFLYAGEARKFIFQKNRLREYGAEQPMAAKRNIRRVLYVPAWPFLWCFGLVVGVCTRGIEEKWRPPQRKRRADWRHREIGRAHV